MIESEILHVVKHPLVADRLALLRDTATPPAMFRRTLEEVGFFLAYEATNGLETREREVRTPLGTAHARCLARAPVVAPILRAGLGLLPGFLQAVGDAITAHVGLYRHPQTLEAIPYYANMPENLSGRDVFVLDPMLATGHSACAALHMLASRGADRITFVCLIAAPEGVAALRRAYPDAHIVAADIDERLNEHGYIVPGLGDAGDRMFGSVSSVPITAREGVGSLF